jgi:hypothetical protein
MLTWRDGLSSVGAGPNARLHQNEVRAEQYSTISTYPIFRMSSRRLWTSCCHEGNLPFM